MGMIAPSHLLGSAIPAYPHFMPQECIFKQNIKLTGYQFIFDTIA